MKSLQLFLVIIAVLTVSITGQGLIGQWVLSNEYLNFTNNYTNMTFTFAESINVLNSISNTLTISACRDLYYTFTYKESTLNPIFQSLGNNNYQCIGNEVNQIRSRMESVFYFSIINNTLLLVYPDKSIVFRLYKNSSIPLTGINGQWSITQLNGKKISALSVDIGINTIQVCNGSVLLNYQLFAGNKISIVQGSGNSSAQQCNGYGEILSTLLNTTYYARNNQLLKLYSGDVHIILQGIISNPNLLPFDKTFLHNKWYISSINSVPLNSKTIPNYNYYFLIINPQRFIFYGGCYVQFAFYDFINGQEVNFRDLHYDATPICRAANNDNVILHSLFNNGMFVQYNQTSDILSFYDQYLNNIFEFTTKVPAYLQSVPANNQ